MVGVGASAYAVRMMVPASAHGIALVTIACISARFGHGRSIDGQGDTFFTLVRLQLSAPSRLRVGSLDHRYPPNAKRPRFKRMVSPTLSKTLTIIQKRQPLPNE